MFRDRTRMRSGFSALCALTLACLLVSVASAQQNSATDSTAKSASSKKKTASHKSASTRSTSSAKTHTTSSKKRRKKTSRVRGQQKIDSQRAQEIQQALIREHYLSGEANGTWNQASEDAMRKYQADHGWQSKQVPDSRALISLGLGPSKDHLLNPESAMTTVPERPKGESMPTTSHTAPATSTPVPATSAPTPAAGPTSDPQ